MKWNVGHTKRPQDGRADRRHGYEWDEEGIDDFSYETMSEATDYDAEPEYLEIGEFEASSHYGAGQEYAQDEAYEAEQDYSADYEGAGYVQDEYAQDGYAQGEYVQDGYAQGEYVQDEYAQGEYSQDGYAQDGYAQGEYAQGEYAQGEYAQGEYVQDGYAQDGYVQGEYVQDGYAQDGYVQDGYVQDEYAQGEYVQDGYVQEEYAQGEYAQGEYVQDGYVQDEYAQGEYAQEEYAQDEYAQDGYGQTVDLGAALYQKKAQPSQAGSARAGRQAMAKASNEFEGAITYIEEYREKPKSSSAAAKKKKKRKDDDGGGFGALDGIIAAVGILVIIGLVVFIGWFVTTHKTPEDPHNQFANIGTQLQGIDLIGGKGIAAVADAELAKIAAAVDVPVDEPDDDPDPGYDEIDYANTIAVAMTLTSVQKDLKIKFSNRETSKLVGNVRFVAQVTKPDGTTEEWIDTDMDGIIYEKGIDAGKYTVALKTLEDDKYKNLILPASSQTVNVKKNIEYAKVDVTGEGKKESEINVSQEDTKKNETTQEGSLTDTVAWVASSSTGNTYTEVLKSTIPDPLTLPLDVAMAKNFMRLSMTNPDDPSGNEGQEGNQGETTTKCKITYNGNGGTGQMAEDSVDAGTSITLPPCGFEAPEGQEFDGWEQGAAGTPYVVNADVVITAKWKEKTVTKCQISFDKNGGEGTMDSTEVDAGSSYTLPECKFNAPENKVFDKWDQGAAGATITVNGSITIKALWKDAEVEKVEITFDKNGGEGTMDSVQWPVGTKYTLPECKFTAPENKEFSKWDLGKPGDQIEITVATKLVAQWTDAVAPITLKLENADLTANGKLALLIKKAADGKTQTDPVTVKVTATTEPAKNLKVEATSKDATIATAAFDATDKTKLIVTAVAKGTTKIIVTADYENEADRKPDGGSKVTKEFEVVVTEKEALQVVLKDKELICYSDLPDKLPVLEVTVKNSSLKAADLIESKMKFTVESSDAMTALVTKKEFVPSSTDGTVLIKLTITPQKLLEKKSCIITVKYEEDTETVTEKCTLTVRPHPRDDKKTLLKDKENNQLFVFENEKYREAVYADYYVEGTKFFVQSGNKYTGWQTLNGKVFFFNAEGKPVTGEQIIQGAKYVFGADGALQVGSAVMGIDVSKWNGSIDWKAVKNSGVNFVIIRVGYRGSSQGSLIEDPKFASNIKGATNAGLKVGVYFFTQAIDEVEAVYEASYVIEKIKNYKISYPVFLDVETSSGRGDKISSDMRTKVCKAFCQTIQNAGYVAGIYANKTWLTEKMDISQLSAYKIWLAQYAAAPTYSGRYDIWQYKNNGSISGISGDVDLNLSYMGY